MATTKINEEELFEAGPEPRRPSTRWALEFPWRSRDVSPERIVAILVDHAVSVGASDMYFATNDDDVEVQIRHFGIIRHLASLSRETGLRCIGHIRTMGSLRLMERRHPQDGRWVVRMDNGRSVDLRINSMPTLYGESLSIRILERDSHLSKLASLGMVGPQLGSLVSALHSPSGLILVTGPTGSGKTTTLYACLHYLNNGARKIHTLEDPIEYAVRGLHQTQVEPNSPGADFQEMLTGVLRQGPDVVLIGEVRDRDSAETAVRASNSGVLVFASLHAPHASAAVQSMLSLGVAGYFLCTSLLLVIGQRLIRTVNRETAVPVDLSYAPRTFEEVQAWLDEPVTVFAPGDDHEGTDGYSGRTGVFEVMKPSSKLRRMIMESRSTVELHQQAVCDGMLDFRLASLLKVAQGITTFDELQRIVPAADEPGLSV
jgi:type II secretory ATPase GspE/PulE/Tfp pilus assembly ATPase PilB-like protein